MADLHKHFKDDPDYIYVKPHLRRRNTEDTPSNYSHRIPRLSFGWFLFLCIAIFVAYQIIKAGGWVIIAGGIALILVFIGLVYIIVRIVYRDRFRMRKLQKTLGHYQSKEVEESLKHQIEDYKRQFGE